MKSLTLCLILILSLLCKQSLSAAIRGNEIMNPADGLALPQTEESAVQGIFTRSRRHTVLSVCTYCCGCCQKKKCGYCCLT
ncbi:hepcidin [Eleutherodactylus coqui]|uniref:Hepcidin n=1 Tax=Eleutherodactylus coqui TaxID=57060 RepID=A0A8J6EQ52_ELECQ|nr:hypothetical protein GDO78_016955 [Eleutherodactylus coqui]